MFFSGRKHVRMFHVSVVNLNHLGEAVSKSRQNSGVETQVCELSDVIFSGQRRVFAICNNHHFHG
jgi:hypothetical protein